MVEMVFLGQFLELVEQFAGHDGCAGRHLLEDARCSFWCSAPVLVVIEDAHNLCVAPFTKRLAVVDKDNAIELRGKRFRILRDFVRGQEVFVPHCHLRVVKRKLVLWPKVQGMRRRLEQRNSFDWVRIVCGGVA